jgi:NADPH:quinone reductase-like Zn-dependent oxidoreductase
MDLLQREGIYPVPQGASKILGVEFSGVVVELGPSVQESFKVGDEVFGLAYGGILALSMHK